MNIAIWLLAGGVLGWLSCMVLGSVERWGLVVSVVLGALGGFAGGNVLAPMLGASRETPNEFSLFSMVVALVAAAALLAIRELVFSRRSKDEPA